MTDRMLLCPHILSRRLEAHSGKVNVPAINVVAFWHGVHYARVDGVTVNEFNLGEPDPLLESGRCLDARNDHQLDELPALDGQLAPLGLLESVL